MAGQGAEVTFEGFLGFAVAGVAALVARRRVFLITEVAGELGLHGAFKHGFGELFEQTLFRPEHLLVTDSL